MLDEARKREVAANLALMGIMAATAAQGPKEFVRMGDVESKGSALMSKYGRIRGEAERNLDSGRVSHPARNIKIRETYDDEMFRQHSQERPLTSQETTSGSSKTSSLVRRMRELGISSAPVKKKKKKKKKEKLGEGKTFKEFIELIYDLEESSFVGRSALASRGPSSNRSDRNKQRQDRSNRAALRKAGFSRSPKPVTGRGARRTKWTETSRSPLHGTETGTFANQSDYAAMKIGNLGPKGNVPTSQRALKAKQIRKQFGGDRTPRPVHDVSVNKSRSYNDSGASTMTKGRSFRQEVTQGVSANLEKAGAKPGDIRTSTPTSDSRSRMYKGTHGVTTNKRTGITVDRLSK